MLMFDAVVPSMPSAGPPGSGASAGGTAKFAVDPDQAQKMITGLKEAVAKLTELSKKGDELTQSGAPGPDPYSGWATLQMRQSAGPQAGGYMWANDAAITALNKTIENIERALAKYRGVDYDAEQAVKG